MSLEVYLAGALMNVLPSFDLTFWITQTIAMALTALFIPKLRVTSIFGPILAVIALSLINSSLWSSSLFSAIPQSFSAQTLTLFVINGGIFWGVVKLLPGIECDGVLPCLVAPLVFTACSVAVPTVGAQIDWNSVSAQAAQLYQETRRYVEPSDRPKT